MPQYIPSSAFEKATSRLSPMARAFCLATCFVSESESHIGLSFPSKSLKDFARTCQRRLKAKLHKMGVHGGYNEEVLGHYHAMSILGTGTGFLDMEPETCGLTAEQIEQLDEWQVVWSEAYGNLTDDNEHSEEPEEIEIFPSRLKWS